MHPNCCRLPDLVSALSDPGAYTEDRLLGGRVILRQPARGYRAAVDPVLLAAVVRITGPTVVMDAGCGSGAALFCLAARESAVHLTGIEIQPELAACAEAALALNGVQHRARIVVGDLAAPPVEFKNHFDLVMTNPPFGAEGTAPPDASLARAHMESHLDLDGWIRACLQCLKPGGRLVMIHRADRLSHVLAALSGETGDIRILPIHPKAGQAARRVIVDAGKGRRSPDTLLPGLILHEPDGQFTAAATAILRDGAGLT